MFAAYLDASKAFDRINHCKLLIKLSDSEVPLYIVRLISFWYSSQQLCIKWGNVLSPFFNVSNGVRQGGILSPMLFNFYCDNLSANLNKIYAGCYCGNIVINHLLYADDLVIFAPSAKGLQKLLDVCSNYGFSHDIMYNASKSKVMYFGSRKGQLDVLPTLCFSNTSMSYVKTFKYLGHIISNDLNDEEDIKSKMRCLYGSANYLNKTNVTFAVNKLSTSSMFYIVAICIRMHCGKVSFFFHSELL